MAGSTSASDAEVGKLILDRTAPRDRLRCCFLLKVDAASSSSSVAVVEDSARGDRCLVPPPGVAGALSVPSLEAAMDGPARGEERSGRELCMGGEIVLYLRIAGVGRSGIVSLCSTEGRRSGKRATGKGATSLGLGEDCRADRI